MSAVNGILLVDKPAGPTSAEVVRRIKKRYSFRKVGHLGTLDPFATGLLPVCVGSGTKIAQFLAEEGKSYEGTIRLGVETDTLDATGRTTRSVAVPAYSAAVLRDLERRFSGEYWQTPPMFSALKREGVPLYRLARQGICVERRPRKVRIDTLCFEGVESHTLRFSMSCSKGTYVRALAGDVGEVLGCGAHLSSLRRTSFGPFAVQHATVASALLDPAVTADALPVLSLPRALAHYRSVSVSAGTACRLVQGQQADLKGLRPAKREREIVRVAGAEGELIAMAEEKDGEWRLVRVF